LTKKEKLKEIKIEIVKKLATPILTYVSEIWALTKTIKKKTKHRNEVPQKNRRKNQAREAKELHF
jgi:heme exporter protein D